VLLASAIAADRRWWARLANATGVAAVDIRDHITAVSAESAPLLPRSPGKEV